MSVSSIGSSFNQIQPAQAVRGPAVASRAAEAASTAVDRADDWPPRTASEMRAAQLDKSAYGKLIAAQEEAASRPSVTARTAVERYARTG
jgi:hypothetical protein